MKIVTTTSVLPYDYPCDKALLRLSDIGFKCLDLAMDYCASVKDGPFVSEDWEKWAEGLYELAEKNGVKYTHSHAYGDALSRSPFTLRCFDVCRVLKTPYCVVHPVFRDENKRIYEDVEEFIKVNAEAIKPLLEAAERNECSVVFCTAECTASEEIAAELRELGLIEAPIYTLQGGWNALRAAGMGAE